MFAVIPASQYTAERRSPLACSNHAVLVLGGAMQNDLQEQRVIMKQATSSDRGLPVVEEWGSAEVGEQVHIAPCMVGKLYNICAS